MTLTTEQENQRVKDTLEALACLLRGEDVVVETMGPVSHTDPSIGPNGTLGDMQLLAINKDLWLRARKPPVYVPWTTPDRVIGKVVRDKRSMKTLRLVLAADTTGAHIPPTGWVNYAKLLEEYELQDGTPCGDLAPQE